jgi:hypothetical protein
MSEGIDLLIAVGWQGELWLGRRFDIDETSWPAERTEMSMAAALRPWLGQGERPFT